MRVQWCRAGAVLLVLGLVDLTGANDAAVEPGDKNAMQLTSSVFAEGEGIPVKYTCDGKNISPPLQWTGLPPGTKSLVLIVDDPDAPSGTWVHWVLYDLPASASELPEDITKGQYLPSGAKQGLNDFKHLGFGGPCPPPGNPHRYFFKLYALDVKLDLKPGAVKQMIEHAMDKHVLAQGQLMGTYRRR